MAQRESTNRPDNLSQWAEELGRLNVEYEHLYPVACFEADYGNWLPTLQLNGIDEQRRAIRARLAAAGGTR